MGTTAQSGGVERFVGTTLDEKYRLERVLGRGGMGAVYLATHLGTERPVALKLIVPRFMDDDRFVERFRREARAAGRLRHPNIVDVTDFGFARTGDDNVAYLVMEYLDGCTLGTVLAEEGVLPLAWVVDILEQVCSAVHEAHRQGIIHRDLKPDNIWLEPNPLGGYRVKVLDFGIAKMLDSQDASTGVSAPEATGGPPLDGHTEGPPPPAHGAIADSDAETMLAAPVSGPSADPEAATSGSDITGVGALLGTPAYMSPEQRRGEILDARSDVYALGIMAYRMLCGAMPFPVDGHRAISGAADGVPIPPRNHNRKIPRGISAAILSAIASDPDQRPASALSFANTLRATADDLGGLYRRGFSLYSEHFPTLFKLSLLAHIPVFAVLVASIGWRLWDPLAFTSGNPAAPIVLGLLSGIANWVTASSIAGTIAILVTQLSLAPLREIRFVDALVILRGRLRPFLRTGGHATLRVMLGFVLLVVPGLVLIARYLLWAPVVLMEGMEGPKALQRSAELASRSRRDIALATLFQLGVPMLLRTWTEMLISYNLEARTGSSTELVSEFASLTSILVSPLVSIVPALLYLKMRQLGGETLSDVAGMIAEPASQRRWEQRMKERLTTPSIASLERARGASRSTLPGERT